ncbi:hypothetical protein [Olleya sp. YS]|uniref:hypothetical protein n=1 Tax=Olleya sp. YS TaxID=3028318 RepID=UPI002434371B|nr:hypothetical protein [Olleya sp. YS]WGD34544.1 hypothetical protein Ollyesu_12235 [Olleya sp. YS]
MKKLIVLLVILSVLWSCKTYKIVKQNQLDATITRTFNFEDFDIYVFKMCEKSSAEVDGDLSSESLAFPFYTNCDDTSKDKVVEETYLLIPKQHIADNTVLYITTFSYKNLRKDCGVFNCELFNSKIFVEDVDIIYLGKLENNSITFYKNSTKRKEQHISTWNIKTDKTDNGVATIKIIDATMVESIFDTKPQIPIESVFSTDVVFHKEDRTLIYGKNLSEFQKACYTDCKEKIIIPTLRGENIGCPVNSLLLSEKAFYFESKNFDTSEYYKFHIDRLFYLDAFPVKN